MKKIHILFLALTAASAPRLWAQPKAEYSAGSVNVGALTYQDPALATFRVRNAGTGDLLIQKVQPGCNCTAVTWTKDPIRPGAEGTLNVTYDASMLGHFEKEVAVWTNADERPVYLMITGEVVREKQEYTGDFPFQVGDIHLSTDNVEFDDVNSGDRQQQVINVLNTGKQPYSPELMHLPKYLTAQYEPSILRSGRAGKIILTLDSRHLVNMGLNQTSVYVSRFPGDKVGHDNEISVSAILLPPFDQDAPAASAPRLEMESRELQLGSASAGKRLKGSLTLTNTGTSVLDIRSLQVFNNALGVDVKRKLRPGETTKLNISVNPRFLNRSRSALRVLMITNDPQQPKVIVNVHVAP